MGFKRLLGKTMTYSLLLAAIACQREDALVLEVKEFPIEEKLDTILSVLPEYYEHLTNSVNCAGDFIVSVNFKAPFGLSVFNKNLCLVDTILPIGRGHNEMLSPAYYGQWESNESNPEIIVYDSETKILAGLDINPFNGLKTIADLKEEDTLSPSSIYMLSDYMLAGINLPLGEQTRVFKYDMKGESVTFAPDYLKFSGERAFYSSQCGLAIDKDRERFAVPYYSVPIMCLLDKDFNLIRKIFIGQEIDTENLDPSTNYNSFVKAIYVGDKIVALYMDVSEEDENKLMVFDGEGNPLASYSVGNALGFCFDSDFSKLLTLNYDEEHGMMKFYVYPVPQLIMK